MTGMRKMNPDTPNWRDSGVVVLLKVATRQRRSSLMKFDTLLLVALMVVLGTLAFLLGNKLGGMFF